MGIVTELKKKLRVPNEENLLYSRKILMLNEGTRVMVKIYIHGSKHEFRAPSRRPTSKSNITQLLGKKSTLNELAL